MSRVGKQPILIPQGVTVSTTGGQLSVNGPKGELKQPLLGGISIEVEGETANVRRSDDEAVSRARHGLMRSLLANMVEGVSQGFTKRLEIHGVGYRVQLAGTDLKFNLGYSHDVVYKIPTGITVSVEQNNITITGIDKQQVGQVAAEIRSLRKPEPYKGKGIRYADERLIRKSGKSGKE